MRVTMRVAVALVGLFNVVLGLGFLFDPVELAARFALSPIGTQGLATIRADFPAFFLTGGVFALVGAWRADSKPLLVPLVLLGVALTGRFVSIAIDGMVATTLPPMIAEALMIVVVLLARRVFLKAIY
ncbi:hypothetical protein [Sphingomonas sp. SUN039]|uniref:hypothetical protein n=1 Tax=Sphingomonas sp. SUN039 TaxID=2937787 RepID=UPI002164506D|nr:hypothetical protein [Sphingomonas sp. SUN039]UVO53246.1 hypothetical protein M0209_03575 [Sphingomonas sp. SUN039]